MSMSCGNCIWCSTGWQDARGVGWCYTENDYVEADGLCACWQASLRDEPLADPPILPDLEVLDSE